jgi:lysine 6-dehydrogenase
MDLLFQLGFGSEKKQRINGNQISPRDLLVAQLMKYVPSSGEDVVLLKVFSKGLRKGVVVQREYTLIDYCDTEMNISAMMRTTGYPVSITAQMIENGTISERGVFCPEEIIPCTAFFKELKERKIVLHVQEKRGSS